ncbi:hypothetical protein ACLMJK_003717 [Lecanora helva]
MYSSRGLVLLINALVFSGWAIITVITRLAFRFCTRRLDVSDAFLLFALLSSVVQTGVNVACVTVWGYGHHKHDLPHHLRASTTPIIVSGTLSAPYLALTDYLQLLWLNQVFFKITILGFKMSACCAYLRLFKSTDDSLFKPTRRVVRLLAFLISGFYTAALFVSVFQCTPVSKSWYAKEAGHCIDLNKFRFYNAGANIITSAFLILTPLPALWRARISTPEVIWVMLLILLGAVHTGCTIARLVLMIFPAHGASKDPQWLNITPLTVALVEMNVGIIAASNIVMHPFLKKYIYPTIAYIIQAILDGIYNLYFACLWWLCCGCCKPREEHPEHENPDAVRRYSSGNFGNFGTRLECRPDDVELQPMPRRASQMGIGGMNSAEESGTTENDFAAEFHRREVR